MPWVTPWVDLRAMGLIVDPPAGDVRPRAALLTGEKNAQAGQDAIAHLSFLGKSKMSFTVCLNRTIRN